ncbi:MAG TPA: TonB family protein [Candidatus Acidoferrales bacterium]|nr:TonB family protein [Candidatus Acidoferrales bacterium]
MIEPAPEWEGQIVAGKFELRAYLGGSESRCVFLTEYDGRPAAIKLIRSSGTEARDHLLRWAQAARLPHPNLVQLLETGHCRIGDADLVYVAMERADEALAEILPQRALTPTEVGEMLPSVLDALRYLHDQGFAHGSVKPSNVLAVGNQVKLSSDAICAVGAGQSRTSLYAAPEAAEGACSAAADLWSLGMTLAQALTQHIPPLPQNDPVALGPLPQPFFDIVSNCLQRDPKRRWTIADILARLQSSCHLPEVGAEAAGESLRLRSTGDWRRMVLGTLLIVLAVVFIFVAPKIRDLWLHRPGDVATFEPKPTSPPDHANPAAVNPEVSPVAKSRSSKEPASPSVAPVDATGMHRAEGALNEVTRRVIPEVPQKARDTIRGSVKVGIRVEIDPSGDVTAASIDSPGPSRYFADLAVRAARQWKFAPIAADGRLTHRTSILRFEFTQGATKVVPAPVQP